MEVRKATDAEDGVVRSVIEAAFGEEGSAVASIWHDLSVRGLVRSSLVAEARGQVVGHVGLSPAWVDARQSLVDVLVLSPLSVLPAEQGSGVGSALLAAALRVADRAGAPAVVLEGSPAYYSARGFVRGSSVGLEAPSRRTPDAAFQVALLGAHEPWMTGRVVYRDVWWEHDAAGLRDPLLAELEQAFTAADG